MYPPAGRRIRRTGARVLVLGHVTVFRCDWPALGDPLLQAAVEREGPVARGAERLRRHGRAAAGPALEDHRPLGVDARRLGPQLPHRDVARTLDAARVPLVLLAHVDDLRGPVGQGLGRLLRRDVHGGVVEVAHATTVARNTLPAWSVAAPTRACTATSAASSSSRARRSSSRRTAT